MRIGWIADYPPYQGGAEIAASRFLKAGFDRGHLILSSEPDHIPQPNQVDVYVVHNCTQYDVRLIDCLRERPVVKYVHDLWPHGDPLLRQWLVRNATLVASSPYHQTLLAQRDIVTHYLIPPPIDLTFYRDRDPAKVVSDVIWLSRISLEKGLNNVLSWAQANQCAVDAYGWIATRIPDQHPYFNYRGKVDQADVPSLLKTYKRLIHLPVSPEPFGLSVVEGWAAGCDLITNERVGATWWLEHEVEALIESPNRFWKLVTTLASDSSLLDSTPIPIA